MFSVQFLLLQVRVNYGGLYCVSVRSETVADNINAVAVSAKKREASPTTTSHSLNKHAAPQNLQPKFG